MLKNKFNLQSGTINCIVSSSHGCAASARAYAYEYIAFLYIMNGLLD